MNATDPSDDAHYRLYSLYTMYASDIQAPVFRRDIRQDSLEETDPTFSGAVFLRVPLAKFGHPDMHAAEDPRAAQLRKARRHLLSGIRQEDVAALFGVSRSTATRAVRRRRE